MKKVFGIIGMLLLVVGCGNAKETTTICKTEDETQTSELRAEGDEIVSSVDTTIMDMADYDYNEGQEEEIRQVIEEELFPEAEAKGVKHKIVSIEGTIVTIETTIDYKKASMAELSRLELVKAGLTDDYYISLEVTLDIYKKDGVICKTKDTK